MSTTVSDQNLLPSANWSATKSSDHTWLAPSDETVRGDAPLRDDLPITTSGSIADHLALTRGREQALKILRASGWDGGIISKAVHAKSAAMDNPGRAFATAAGYVAHAICQNFCQNNQH